MKPFSSFSDKPLDWYNKRGILEAGGLSIRLMEAGVTYLGIRSDISEDHRAIWDGSNFRDLQGNLLEHFENCSPDRIEFIPLCREDQKIFRDLREGDSLWRCHDGVSLGGIKEVTVRKIKGGPDDSGFIHVALVDAGLYGWQDSIMVRPFKTRSDTWFTTRHELISACIKKREKQLEDLEESITSRIAKTFDIRQILSELQEALKEEEKK